MHFASPIPWWLALLVLAGIGALAVFAYWRPLVPLSRRQRITLTLFRGLALLALFFFACRPVLLLPPATAGDVVVPVLVDVSRSMRIADADGESRLAKASTIVAGDLMPVLSRTARVELFAFADQVAPVELEALAPNGRTTDLGGAIETIKARFRGRLVAGIVVLSDGGDTTQSEQRTGAAGPPVFAIGLGSSGGPPDREVTGISAGDPRLDQASIDLHVSVRAHGYGREPFPLRLLADGRLLETRRVAAQSDGSPISETFTVFPDPLRASVYTAEIAAEPQESVSENNSRSLVVNPAGRRRRVLVLAGAPGYDHTFMMRALQQDPGLELDSVVRKGKNDANQDTFLVQAGGGRAPLLTSGFPATRQALFDYDAIVIANMEGDFFSRAQLQMTADFVDRRGGGLLVLGGRSFERRGLIGTPLESVLPLELSDRRGGPIRAAGEEGPAGHDAVALTEEGARHPVMRIGASPEESKKLWATLPPLAASAPVGGPRPGASVLAVTSSASGGVLPVVAVQRYGRGRSMIFAGEAAWRWRMLVPAGDRRYDFFWRQALRWLTTDAPEPVTLTMASRVDVGDPLTVEVEARDRAFEPVEDATLDAVLTAPGVPASPVPTRPAGAGRFSAVLPVDAAGLYRFQVEARRAGSSLGTADRWFLASNDEREFADPRLNDGLLRRLARESGGRYVEARDAGLVAAAVSTTAPAHAEPERRDLWHEPWALLLVLALLSAEWILRRQWGMR